VSLRRVCIHTDASREKVEPGRFMTSRQQMDSGESTSSSEAGFGRVPRQCLPSVDLRAVCGTEMKAPFAKRYGSKFESTTWQE
jgi:hypothetical protein